MHEKITMPLMDESMIHRVSYLQGNATPRATEQVQSLMEEYAKGMKMPRDLAAGVKVYPEPVVPSGLRNEPDHREPRPYRCGCGKEHDGFPIGGRPGVISSICRDCVIEKRKIAAAKTRAAKKAARIIPLESPDPDKQAGCPREGQKLFTCSCGKEHGGFRIEAGVISTVCEECVINIRKAKGIAAIEQTKSLLTKDTIQPGERKGIPVLIYNDEFPDLYVWLKQKAKIELREPEMQAIWELLRISMSQSAGSTAERMIV